MQLLLFLSLIKLATTDCLIGGLSSSLIRFPLRMYCLGCLHCSFYVLATVVVPLRVAVNLPFKCGSICILSAICYGDKGPSILSFYSEMWYPTCCLMSAPVPEWFLRLPPSITVSELSFYITFCTIFELRLASLVFAPSFPVAPNNR